MNKRLAAMVVVLALAVGVFIGREFAPMRPTAAKGPAGARYEFLPIDDGEGICRADRQTGEVTTLARYEGTFTVLRSTSAHLYEVH